jgi:hypothetical protein
MFRRVLPRALKIDVFSMTTKVMATAVASIWISLTLLIISYSSPVTFPPTVTTTGESVLTSIIPSHPVTPPKAVSKLQKEPLIVMSTGGGRWNTGVWTGYGGPEKIKQLRWAHEGILVDKSQCPYKCRVTHEQNEIENADAG